MNHSLPEWLSHGRGITPELRWSVNLEGSLAGLCVSRETGHTIAADDAGGLYRLNRSGAVTEVSRSFSGVRCIATADTSHAVAAVLSDRTLVWLDAGFQLAWKRSLPEDVTGLAMDPHGDYLAVSQADHRTVVYRSNRSRFAQFKTTRPLKHLLFSCQHNELIGASADGFIAKHTLQGRLLWKKDLITPIGDLSGNVAADLLLVAAYAHGVQIIDGFGEGTGTFVMSGTPFLVSQSVDGQQVVVATQEGRLCLMTMDGDLVWDVDVPDPVVSVSSPPGQKGLVFGFGSGRITRLVWPGLSG